MAQTAVVAGAGVIGAFSAYSLAKRGWTVTLLDKSTVGAGASHGNCGYICPSHALPLAVPGALASTLKTLFHRNSPLKVRPGAVLANLGWFLGFARKCNTEDSLKAAEGISALLNSSNIYYHQFLEPRATACDWQKQGLLFVFQTEKAFHHYAESDKLLADKFHQHAKRMLPQELETFEPALKPGSAAGGYWYPGDSHVRPDWLLKELKRTLLEMNVTIVEGCTVTEIVREQGKAMALRTNKGDFQADGYVMAMGAWSPLFNKQLRCKLPIVPGKGYSLTVPRWEKSPKVPMIFEEHRVAVTPFATGFRIGSTMEFGGYNEEMNPKRIELLTTAAKHYLPGELPTQNVEPWWGWRPMVYDGNPIIDFAPGEDNLVVAAGHGMLGLSQGPGTGELVAELLSHTQPHIDPTPYKLNRF